MNIFRKTLLAVLVLTIVIPLDLFLLLWGYTTFQLDRAKREGIYSTVEEGLLSQIQQNYINISRIEILNAGTNSLNGSNPHVGFASAVVCAERYIDGRPVGDKYHDCDVPGWFFLLTKDGWVFMPEGAFPEIIGLGMVVFGLTGKP